MRRRRITSAIHHRGAAALLATFCALAPSSAAVAQTATPQGAAPVAYVVVDADTGRVVVGENEHSAQPVGGLAKLITAVMAVERFADDDTIAPGPKAIASPQRSMNGDSPTSMAEGQQWPAQDLIAGIIVESANDAAYALAEAMGGNDLNTWGQIAQATLDRLGRKDQSFVIDPAGIDDGSGVAGGPAMSAFDVAIVARNVVKTPLLADMAAQTTYDYKNSEGQVGTLSNQNELVTQPTIEGINGLRAGFTNKSGQTVVATAERDGRTMIVVMLKVGDAEGWAASLLDQGFAQAAATEAGEQLPAVAISPYAQRANTRDELVNLALGEEDSTVPPSSGSASSTSTTSSTESSTPSSTAAKKASGGGGGISKWIPFLLFILVVGYLARVVQVKRRRSRRRADRHHRERMIRRGSLPIIEPPIRSPDRNAQTSSSHVRVRKLDDPDNPEEPWDDEDWK